jgi:Na+/phosphate symporter
MNARIKNLIGTIIFVAGSGAYFLFVISVALARLPDTPMTTQLLFYLVTTLIWLFFAGLLIRWMAKGRQA